MKRLGLLAALAAVLLLATPAWAHFLWLNISPEQAKLKQPCTLSIGWGHHFPKTDKLNPDKIKSVKALGPTGQAVKLSSKAPMQYEFMPGQAGTYLALAAYKTGYVTKTTEGYKRGTKEGLKEVITCFHYDLRTKALVPVGSGAGVDKRVGDILEIVPLQDVGKLKKGDTLKIKVWFKDQPLAKAKVHATYADFSTKPNTFAFKAETNGQGIATVKLLGSGLQMIAVGHKIPYPDRKVCDDLLYKYTLTFNLP